MKGKRRQEEKSQNGWIEGGEVMKEGKINGRRDRRSGSNEKRENEWKEERNVGQKDGWMN